MAVKVGCPNPECDASFSVEPENFGKAARCKKCGTRFRLGEGAESVGGGTRGTAGATTEAEPAQVVDLPSPFGRYRIVRRLGRGGMGAVYLAHDTQLDRKVALKVPGFRAGESPALLERFYREARAAAGLHHPNLCPVHDVGQVGGVHFLTMAYLEGQTLARVLKERGRPFGPAEAARLVRTLARAIAAAHARGVVHRDLKPGNVMMTDAGEPVVLDFGLARRTESDEERLTFHGQVMGTPAYMAPEQVRGDTEAIGPACDVYSLGVILYELLTGRSPYKGSAAMILSLVTMKDPPRPGALQPGLDPELERICLKAMAKAIEHRYASMAEFAEALERYLGGPGESGPRRALPLRRRRGRAVGAAVALGLIAMWVGAWVATDRGRVRLEVGDPDSVAAILLDGREVELSDLGEPLTLPAGEHLLKVTRRDREPQTRRFVVRRGEEGTLTVEPPARAPESAPAPPGRADAPGDAGPAAKLPGGPGPGDAAPPSRPTPPTASTPRAPGLVAVESLRAHAGRGRIRVFAVDPVTGEVVYDLPGRATGAETRGAARKSRGLPGMMGGYGGMMGMGLDREATARRARETEARKRMVGGALPDPGAGAPGADDERPEGAVAREEVRGFRWVAVTGVLDHRKVREGYAEALGVPIQAAHPQYLRAELERQERHEGGDWSPWMPVDRAWIEANVMDRLTEVEPEIVPGPGMMVRGLLRPGVRLAALVDPLPLLEHGSWVGVYPVELADPEALREAEAASGPRDGASMMGGGVGGLMSGMMGDYGGMISGMLEAAARGELETTEAQRVLVRSLDFTVEPATTYRYRARVVAANPYRQRGDAPTDADRSGRELVGPWSQPSMPAAVLPDVAIYLADARPEVGLKGPLERPWFRVGRWDAETGLTAVAGFRTVAGTFVGRVQSVNVPDAATGRPVARPQDFTSGRLLVDYAGGTRDIGGLGLEDASEFDAPALALLLRPDGRLELREEAIDADDPDLQGLDDAYRRSLEERP